MELRDLIVTPVLLIVLYVLAYIIRPYVTDDITRPYFLPGLTVRIIGALAVGFIYQFYYGGGDTFNFHTHGSRHIWEAFLDSPEKGLKLFFGGASDQTGIYKYSSRIFFLRDSSSFAVIRVAAVLDLITFSSYSATAILFAVLNFIGMWMFFLAFYQQYPHLHKPIAIAVLFVPSVFFWGSGLLKDTITLSCVGIATYQVYRIFIRRQFFLRHVVLLLVASYTLYVIKIYILLTFLPAVILWVFLFHFQKVRSVVLRMLLAPLVISMAIVFAYFAMAKAGEDNPRYSMGAIARTAQVTAYDIRYWTGREAGSGYELGELDGTWQSMIRLAPQAVNVSLFRPYFWEVRNPLMLISAVESFALLIITLFILFRVRMLIFKALAHPTVLFCMIFSLVFAFAVGVSTFNFGTLTRYKIPLLPFYVLALILIWDYSNKERNRLVFDSTE